MSRKNQYGFYSALERNMEAYYYYVNLFAEIAISMFEWEGLPDTVDPRYLELALFEEGSAIYFNDDALGDLCLSCLQQGGFNAYGYPNRRRAYSRYSHYHKALTPQDSVIIYNNLLHTNSYPTIKWFAKRLWNLDRIVDVNSNAQKTPVAVTGPENKRLTLENAYKQFDGNEPVIFFYKDYVDKDAFSVLKTDAPFIADKIYQLKVNIFNEGLTFLGIPNSVVNKKERLLKDEVHRDLGGTLASRNSRLVSRQRGAELVNKMFGTGISVAVRGEEELLESVDSGLRRLGEMGGEGDE